MAKPFVAEDLVRKVREVLDARLVNEPAPSPSPGSAPSVPEDGSIRQADLDRLTAEVRDQLRRAALSARYDELCAALAALRATEPGLAMALQRLADEFDYGGMVAALA
jgi:hypothetical protein